MSSWGALIRLHRFEYPFPVHYLCYAVWGACYAVRDTRQLLAPPVLLVIGASLILLESMNLLNAAMDIRTDALNPNKADIADATLLIGAKFVTALATVEMVLAQVLAIIASLWVARWFVAITAALIIVLHLLYNIEPVHLKRRGIVNPLTLGASLTFLPCLMSYTAVRPDFTGPVWLIFAGLGASVTGRSLWWMIPDRAADAAAETVTLAVRYGAVRMIVVACLIAAAVPCLLGWGLWWRYGPTSALAGIVASGAFLAGQLPLLRQTEPNYAHLRRRNMTPMMIANVFLAVLPLTTLS